MRRRRPRHSHAARSLTPSTPRRRQRRHGKCSATAALQARPVRRCVSPQTHARCRSEGCTESWASATVPKSSALQRRRMTLNTSCLIATLCDRDTRIRRLRAALQLHCRCLRCGAVGGRSVVQHQISQLAKLISVRLLRCLTLSQHLRRRHQTLDSDAGFDSMCTCVLPFPPHACSCAADKTAVRAACLSCRVALSPFTGLFPWSL